MEDKPNVLQSTEIEGSQLSMIDEDGNEVLYEVILTFESVDFDKSYLLMVPVELPDEDDEESIEVVAYSYTTKEDGSIDDLFPVETDEEWDMIEEVFNTNFDEIEDDFDFDDEEE